VKNHNYARLEVFTPMKFQVEIFWVVTPFSTVVWYQRFKGPCCLHLHPECGGSMELWNVGILPQDYTASQPKSFCFVVD